MADKKTHIVEKDWTTKAGFRAVVLLLTRGHRCGYLGVEKGHPLHGIDYGEQTEALPSAEGESVGKRSMLAVLVSGGNFQSPEMVFDVHGGLTFAGAKGEYPVNSDLWWFGFDCAHCGDAIDRETLAKHGIEPEYEPISFDGDVVRSLDYCVDELESLAEQMATKVKPND